MEVEFRVTVNSWLPALSSKCLTYSAGVRVDRLPMTNVAVSLSLVDKSDCTSATNFRVTVKSPLNRISEFAYPINWVDFCAIFSQYLNIADTTG